MYVYLSFSTLNAHKYQQNMQLLEKKTVTKRFIPTIPKNTYTKIFFLFRKYRFNKLLLLGMSYTTKLDNSFTHKGLSFVVTSP